MAGTEDRLMNARDGIQQAEYAVQLAEEQLESARKRLVTAKEKYLAVALETPSSHPTGFQRAELPVTAHQQGTSCCCHH